MTVITISREFGSEGERIAQDVAQALDYHFVDRKLIGMIIGQYGYVEFDREYARLPTFWERFDVEREKERDVVVSLLNRVIQSIAHHGHARAGSVPGTRRTRDGTAGSVFGCSRGAREAK
jgi:hypothetical protein